MNVCTRTVEYMKTVNTSLQGSAKRTKVFDLIIFLLLSMGKKQMLYDEKLVQLTATKLKSTRKINSEGGSGRRTYTDSVADGVCHRAYCIHPGQVDRVGDKLLALKTVNGLPYLNNVMSVTIEYYRFWSCVMTAPVKSTHQQMGPEQ